ncbi:BQ2448_6128 [Microbotryum intermedium]|uniref:Mediator of RNA polymerase II transcription subunit 11 n=1 Tax=Microbotryum intermedium TaxID=269621 RepID=A0A238FR62_9BASI|nr:BQ2448_6128 [Microbotryum intermedium]
MSALVGYTSSSASSDHDDDMQGGSVEVDDQAPSQPPPPPPTEAEAAAEVAPAAPAPAPPGVTSEQPQQEDRPDGKEEQDEDEDQGDDDDDDDKDDDVTPEPDYSFASPPPPPLDANGDGEDGERDLPEKKPALDDDDKEERPTTLKAATRIHELDAIQQDIAKLLHLAGCTLASLDPEPNPNLDPTTEKHDPDTTIPEDKKERFDHFARSYFTTLNKADLFIVLVHLSQDIQLSLRTSIRHLALSKPSPQALLDPNYASLLPTAALEPGQSSIAAGGTAHRSRIDPLPLTKTIPKWKTGDAKAASAGGVKEDGSMKLSVAARELQAEAWRDLAQLGAGQHPTKGE